MKSALAKANVSEGFMNSVSPGTVAVFQPNEYYPTHEAYMAAVSEGMRAEYEEIVKSGCCCSWIVRIWRWDGTRASRIWTRRGF
jgi:hypothetical protein